MGGLCNRLRTILSYRAVYGSLEVEWLPIQVGAGTWDEVFEPLEGVTFVTPGPWTLRHEGGPVLVHGGRILSNEWAVKSELRGQADEPTWVDCNPLATAPMGWQMAYRDVRLTPALIRILPERPYQAMHVRRTDHTPMVKSWGVRQTLHEEYARWALDFGARGNFTRFLIATDNEESVRVLSKAIGLSRCFVLGGISTNPTDGETRATPMWHAALDLFACVRASHFLGSPGSSFTDTIELLRSMQGWWS